MENNANSIRIASLLQRLDPELSASDAEYVAKHIYAPIGSGYDPGSWLAVRLDRKPDHHTWGSIADLMWRARKILSRINKERRKNDTY